MTIWADRAGADIVQGAPGADPASVAHDACDRALARGVDVLIVDTAGRLHTQSHLMRELEKIRNVLQRKIPGAPHEVLLVLDATNGQNAIRQAEVFTKSIGCTGVILTKLDGTAKGGVVVAVRQTINLPVKFIGVGEAIDDLQPFDADTFVESLFISLRRGRPAGRSSQSPSRDTPHTPRVPGCRLSPATEERREIPPIDETTDFDEVVGHTSRRQHGSRATRQGSPPIPDGTVTTPHPHPHTPRDGKRFS